MILHGEALTHLRALPDSSVDSIVTDPPYGLSKEPDMVKVLRHWLAGDDYVHTGGGFMGKAWDSFVPGPSIWKECLRVLKPGGHLLSFFGARTCDIGVLAIRLAGFEIRDQIMWVYASGFPKSMDVSKAIDKALGATREVTGQREVGGDMRSSNLIGQDKARLVMDVTTAATPKAQQWEGWGTALKPAHEPICLARKPLIGTVAQNVLAYGTGALNIDACRVEATGESQPRENEASQEKRYTERGATSFSALPGVRGGDPDGRFPANFIHDGSAEVLACFPDAPGAQAVVTGNEPGRSAVHTYNSFDGYRAPAVPRGDVGSAARFFYCAKVSAAERHHGLKHPGQQFTHGNTLQKVQQAETRKGNFHPTVKPVELMRYLVRLVTPPNGTVLDPYAGSGSTGVAAIAEGFNPILIEREAEYVAIIEARCRAAQPGLGMFEEVL